MVQSSREPGGRSRAEPSVDRAASPIHPLVSGAPPRWFTLTLLGAVAIVAWLPLMAVLATFAAVIATGCQVDEATTRPCIVAGHDIADALGTGLLLAFVAGPATLIAIGASAGWVLLWRRHRRLAG